MRTWNVVVLMGLVAAAGCSKSAPAPVTPAEDLAARAQADSIAAVERARADSMARAEAARIARADSLMRAERARAEQMARDEASRLEQLRVALRDTLGQRVHFAFDRAEIRPDDRLVLDRKEVLLRTYPKVTLRIAGHADERGSDEYNFALGARRAAAARTYLVNRGIAQDRLEVVSYGEERPLIAGHDESAWSMNRRNEFTVVAGLESLGQPMAGR